ncbi:response regulator transcription factor [Chloroflexota bacterium]
MVKILIVDDSILVQQRLVDLLAEIDGIEVVGKARGESEALSKVIGLVPDVVILDIRLLEGNGINVLQNIKNDGANSTIVIIITSYPYPQYRNRCMAAGADFFFSKSTEFDKIPEVLKRLVIRSNSRGTDLERTRRG